MAALREATFSEEKNQSDQLLRLRLSLKGVI
jgi:hypothetical protein